MVEMDVSASAKKHDDSSRHARSTPPLVPSSLSIRYRAFCFVVVTAAAAETVAVVAVAAAAAAAAVVAAVDVVAARAFLPHAPVGRCRPPAAACVPLTLVFLVVRASLPQLFFAHVIFFLF